ncbi:siderophore-interacting protein [Rhizobium sp. RM]|uniref:siderophore-interacting protein n=1 Tax=Rhizobium sp. RM TaxID=2748079 RepID=UPI0015B47948|nr:siderophore-interacting protein [Rhizobium sp. RM]NWJ25351.1 siderophore-interacting protein [Rhizobium sp. RM]
MSEYFIAEVLSVVRVSPNMIRIDFGGKGLAEFRSSGRPDEWTRLMFPTEPGGQVDLPILLDGKWKAPPACELSPARPYTVRKWMPGLSVLTIEFVVHEGGIAADWARKAFPGDRIVVSAPFGRFTPPSDAGWTVLLADITGLPAVARIIEERGALNTISAHVELPHHDDRQELPVGRGVTLHWYDSFGKDLKPTRLLDIAQAITLPDGEGYLYIAGEATAASDVRKHFRDVKGIDKERITSVGYWIEGQSRG